MNEKSGVTTRVTLLSNPERERSVHDPGRESAARPGLLPICESNRLDIVLAAGRRSRHSRIEVQAPYDSHVTLNDAGMIWAQGPDTGRETKWEIGIKRAAAAVAAAFLAALALSLRPC